MNYSQKGLELTERFEGIKLKAYPDPGTGGAPWTIGYGHTRGVRKGDTCTREQAEQWLLEDVQFAEDAVNKYVQVPLTQGMFDALVDFVFNVGEGNFYKSTLLRKLNNRDYKGADAEFAKWDKAAGKVLPGLVSRRQAEDDLFDEDSMG